MESRRLLASTRDVETGGKPLKVAELIGGNIRSLRVAAGLTQAELADAMRAIGLETWQRQTVAETEAGRRDVTVEELIAVAAFFEMPLFGIVASPGGLVTQRWIDVGRRRLGFADWMNLIEQKRGPLDPAPAPVRRAIDTLVKGLPRPWAVKWRRSGNGPSAFAEARDELRATRTRLPGPIFLWRGEGDLKTSTTIPPWGASVSVKLEHGVPYYARDEQEAEQLLEVTKTHPQLRVISRQEAYRLRKKGGR